MQIESKKRFDFALLISVLLVLGAGLLTLYSQEAILETSGNTWIRQTFHVIFGIILMLVLRRVNYQYLGEFALPLYGFGLFLLLITLVPFIGSDIKGARSWIRIGGFGVQTSELSKLFTIILLAKFLELKERELDRIPTLLIGFSIALVPMVLIVVQPDFGGAFSFAPILMTMLYIAGADILHIGSVVIFFGLTIFIPLFIEYKKITMVDPLISHIANLDQNDILPAVRILKKDIWDFVEKGIIPGNVTGGDRSYLHNILNSPSLYDSLKEGAQAIQYESGGFLLMILDNDWFVLSLGIILSTIAVILFGIKFARGRQFNKFRKLYIPLGVIGVSLLSAMAVHMTISFKYHQVVRITAFLNPDKFPRDLAYQIRASKAAIGSGEFSGKGLFEGDMTMGERPLVPEAHTDFIFTAWGERTGFLGSAFLLILMVFIPLRGLQISYESRDRFASILGSGISFMFFYHIVLNIGIALGLLPVTGLPLSFLSYGGSHMIITLSGIGILLSIYRRRYAN